MTDDRMGTGELVIPVLKKVGPDSAMWVAGVCRAVLKNQETGKVQIFEGPNIVTTAGSTYYAQRAATTYSATKLQHRGAAGTATPVEEFNDGTDGEADDAIAMSLFNNDSPANAVPAVGNNWSDMTIANLVDTQALNANYPRVNDNDADNTGNGVTVITYMSSWTVSEAIDTAITDVVLTGLAPSGTDALLMHSELSPINKTASDTLKVFINHTFLGV